MECRDAEVETVELADLSTLMYVPDGGFTWYPETEELANRGFAVSVGGGQLVKDIRDLSPNEVEEILVDYVDEYQDRSEEHTSELQSRGHLVCRLLLEKKKRVQFW